MCLKNYYLYGPVSGLKINHCFRFMLKWVLCLKQIKVILKSMTTIKWSQGVIKWTFPSDLVLWNLKISSILLDQLSIFYCYNYINLFSNYINFFSNYINLNLFSNYINLFSNHINLFSNHINLFSNLTPVTCSIHLRHSALELNRRCVLAYLKQRLNRITQFRWDHGAVLPEEIQVNMQEHEVRVL